MNINPKDLADKLDAEDRLRNRGYVKDICEDCKGIGGTRYGHPCYSCQGRGYTWSAPLMHIHK